MSKKDTRYFIDTKRYNCPFCSTASVRYKVHDAFSFNWDNDNRRYGILIVCQEPDCQKISIHLSKYKIHSAYDDRLGLPLVKAKDAKNWKDY